MTLRPHNRVACCGRNAYATPFPMQNCPLPAHLETPAFVLDLDRVRSVMAVAQSLQESTGCRVLYSVKALCLPPMLTVMAPVLDGFAVSSAFEARLTRTALAGPVDLHFTSPGIRPTDVEALAEACSYVSFNSLGQWKQWRDSFQGRASVGIRINPERSFLDDERYDPCRPYSKLGVPLSDIAASARVGTWGLGDIEGILVHSNCESTNFAELRETVDRLVAATPDLLGQAAWINLGGGYFLDEGIDLEPLRDSVAFLQGEFGLTVFIEPGAAFARAAGFMVSTVLDVFASGGKKVAILDASVNHMPELLEFDFEPDVVGHRDEGRYEYVLAGCTCLAGDVFGEYRFDRSLSVGDRVTFHNVGSYSMAKAHTFNGVNLPSIYVMDASRELSLYRKFGYDDYSSRWLADDH